MRYITLIILIVLTGCSPDIGDEAILNRAKKCCSCRGGINAFTYNTKYFIISCKDGLRLQGDGNINYQRFICGCSE